MHGHALVALAEEEHVTEWTDISVGGLYGAVRRLAAEGLIEPLRLERQGNYPERQVYGISASGRQALRALQRDALADVVLRPDPVDLGLARLDPDALDELHDVIRTRRDTIATLLEAEHEKRARIRQYLTVAEWHATSHDLHRLQAELAWHDDLLAAVPDIIRDERNRTSTPKEDR